MAMPNLSQTAQDKATLEASGPGARARLFRTPPGRFSFLDKRLAFFESYIDAYARAHPAERIRILDLGCGNGTIAKWLASRFSQADVVGLDIDEGNIILARQGAPTNARFVCQSLWKMPPDWRKDGLLLATTPNGFGLMECFEHGWGKTKSAFRFAGHLFDLMRRLLISTRVLGENERDRRLMELYPHVQTFTLRRLRQLGASAHMKLVGIGHTSFLKGCLLWDITFGRSARLREWDSCLADHLPSSMVNGWLLAYAKTSA
ncbi:MAG: class I SAM-dependent methyltransferase [Chloroflexi bacterium]|nr:class I SAM-dependent methyltransferase [Chloroflexota bacterium]